VNCFRIIIVSVALFFSGFVFCDNHTDLKKLFTSKNISLPQKKASIYSIIEKIENKEADKTLFLCDELLNSDEQHIIALKEWIKLVKAYSLKKSNNKKGLIELLKSINTGNDKDFTFYVESLLGQAYMWISDYNNSLGYFQNNLIYFTNTKPDVKKQSFTCGKIANCYRRMKMKQQAIQMCLKGLTLAEQTKDSLTIYHANNSLAVCYLDFEDYKRSDSIFNILLNYTSIINEFTRMALYSNYSENNLFLNKTKEAEEMAEKSYKIAVAQHDTFWCAIILITKAKIASKQNKYSKAVEICKTAYDYAKKTKSLVWQQNACECIFENAYKDKNYKEAFDYYKTANNLKDSILSEDNRKEITRKEFQFEYQLKTAADSIRQIEANKVKDAQIQAQESQLKQEKIVRFSLFAVAILILTFSVFIYNRFKVTKKQNTIIEKQKSQLEIKQKEILDSIHYAKRIQNSLLPTERYIDRNLNKK